MPKKKTVKFQNAKSENKINLQEIKKTARNLQHAIHKKKTEGIKTIRNRVLQRKYANKKGTRLNDPHISKVMGLVKKYVSRPMTSKITRKNGSFSKTFENGFVDIYEHDYEREHSNKLPIKKRPDPEEVTKKHSFMWAPKLRKKPTKQEIEERNETIQLSKEYMNLHRPGLNRMKRYRVNEPEYPNPFVKMSGLYPKIK
jgi:hypothetical protein